jgi:hypothetical protein
MNQSQRKTLSGLVAQLDTIKDAINDMATEEQDKYDNLSEGLQQSDNGQKFEVNASTLNDAVSELESVINNLGEVE